MKSIIAVFSSLFIGTIAINAQIVNGNFENWSDSILYETPTDWNSSNQQLYYYENTVFKSTDAQQGNYAAKIGVAEMFNDSVGGHLLHGSLSPVTGIPYTDNFEAVAVNYKIDLQPNDSLYLVLVRKNNGNIVDYQLKPFAFAPLINGLLKLPLKTKLLAIQFSVQFSFIAELFCIRFCATYKFSEFPMVTSPIPNTLIFPLT